MEILIIRHALAEERETWINEGKSDALRPLCKKGIVRFAQALQGLEKLVRPITTIYSSQYTRAVQTGEILHGHYENSKFEIIEALNPGVPFSRLIGVFNNHGPKDVIALVGHQPDLGRICSHFITGQSRARIKFRKGGVASVNYENGVGELQFLLTQRQLQALSFSKNFDFKENSEDS